MAQATPPQAPRGLPGAPGVDAARIPVTLITGFLGSGKTTLVNAILRNPGFAGTLVIVNEFGEVGLDHLLVGSAQDQVVLLDSGCLCCAASGSLRDTLIDIFARRAAGHVPPFDRIFVETSGLAHPGPLVATLIGDSALRPRCALAGVLTLVDAVHGADTLREYAEARHQVAFADRLVLTKTDQIAERDAAGPADILHGLNPSAPLRRWHPGMAPEPVFLADGQSGPALLERPEIWLSNLAGARRLQALAGGPDTDALFADEPAAGMRPAGHGTTYRRVRSHVLHGDGSALPWPVYADWTRALASHLGRKLLRCKGVLRMEDGHAWVVQGVQGYFAPPERLPADAPWPGQAFLVCIVDDVATRQWAAVAADVPELPPFSFAPPLPIDDSHG